MNLSRFQRPSRYIDSEVNSVLKEGAPLSVALAFPDVYDVGMSHLGLKILYDIINRLPFARAERVFHPWLDLESEMKSKGIPLVSLESQKPASGFDILGFSLQYELSYTSVLNMLSLSGLPLRSEERTSKHPLVIAGGPCAVNPMPMSPFIDAFFIGDAEYAIAEICETALRWKTEGDGRRESLLKALSAIEGVYVPSFGGRVRRRIIESLDEAPYPLAPIVPYAPIVHDRVNVEVSRGCPMGCRYCQAGMIYRPARERSLARVMEIAEKSLASTGYEEVSFTSLSAGDYSCLLPLLKEFNGRFAGDRVTVSLPSLRVKAVNEELLEEMKTVRKTGFTIAPEAATARLRAVINKDFSDEDYEAALMKLFKAGWLNLKLYFMTGLPTETDEDIAEIPRMASKALITAKSFIGRYVNITLSVSPFVPKAHTAFQWCGQEPLKEIRRKRDYLRRHVKGVTLKGHDERLSMLEAAFSRGDEALSRLAEAAFREGARLDGWSEAFDYNAWFRAMDKSGIDAQAYASRTFDINAPLPWDMIDTGVTKDFLMEEYASALSGMTTPGCISSCAACGLECVPPSLENSGTLGLSSVGPALTLLNKPVRLRAEFSKTGRLRYLSHRELITLIARAIRRAGVRMDYTKGFHPSAKLSLGPPLSVGVSGLREYFDVEILTPCELESLKDLLDNHLPEGVRIGKIAAIAEGEPSLQSFISAYEYEIICPDPQAGERFGRFISEPTSLGGVVESAEIGKGIIRLVLRDTAERKVRLDEITRAMLDLPLSDVEATRVALYGMRNGQRALPI